MAMATLNELNIPINNLLLDPNNFRYQDEPGYVTADTSRFHEGTVQDRAKKRLRSEGLTELKNSILTNRFLPVERLVVRRYEHVGGKYLVVEGNRRLAALQWIADDYEAGVVIAESVLKVLEAVPAVLIEGDEDDSIYLSLMGIRHVGGIRQWGGYQRAKLVTELRDKHQLDSADIGNRLGMSTQEVNRRYRAFKALEKMQEDEDFGDQATPSMYTIFHEAVSLPVVREWLGWTDADGFSNEQELAKFYELITPTEREDGEQSSPPKIVNYSQVRDLRAILPVPEARRVLLESDRSFSEALALAKAEELSRSWASQVAEAIAALRSVGALELRTLDAEGIREIENLRDIATSLLETHRKIIS